MKLNFERKIKKTKKNHCELKKPKKIIANQKIKAKQSKNNKDFTI